MDRESIAFGRMSHDDDGGTLRDVYRASHDRLVEQVYGVTGDRREAEVLVQDAFVRAADAERRFRRADDPEAWLRSTAVRVHHSRWRSMRRRWGVRGRVPHGDVRADVDELVCRGVRRRARRRTALAAAAYGIAVVAGAVELVGGAPTPSPSPAPVVLRTGLPEVEEVGDRIPPGRAGMPAPLPDAPAATVSVEIPRDGRWRESSSGSGIYAPVRRGTAWLHLATYAVDGVVRRPCRSSYLPAAAGVAAGFARPGPTPADLADAIAGMPRADVVVPPHPVATWGTTAVHERLRVPRARCRSGNLLWTFDTERGGEFLGNVHARLDFWVLELGGRAVVVETEMPMGATVRERRLLTGLLDSVELPGHRG